MADWKRLIKEPKILRHLKVKKKKKVPLISPSSLFYIFCNILSNMLIASEDFFKLNNPLMVFGSFLMLTV